MAKALGIVLLLALAGCAGMHQPSPVVPSSACAVHEASYACQVERYHNVAAP